MLKARGPFSYGDIPTFEAVQDPYTDKQRQPYMENPQRNAYETSNLSRNKQDLEDEYGTKLGGTFGTGSLSKGY